MLASMAAPQVIATTVTWTGNGANDTGGTWSVTSNWNTPAAPITGDTAVLTDVTTAVTRSVTYDAAATGALGTLQMDQATTGALNQVEFVRDATVANAITLEAAAGTEAILLTPSTTQSRTLTANGGITLNAGGLLTMAAAYETIAGPPVVNNQRISKVTGNVTLAGGTLLATPSGFTTSSNQREISGSLTMTGGILSLDGGASAQTRIQCGGNLTITGGTVNRGAGASTQIVLGTNGGVNTVTGASFDKWVAISMLNTNIQSLTVGVPVGEVLMRQFGSGEITKTITTTGLGSVGRLSFGCSVGGSTSNLVMGSSLAITNDPPNGSMPAGSFGVTAALVTFGIDTAGYLLDLSAARGNSSTTTWSPNVAGGTTNWNLINSGAVGQGGIKAANVNFASATQVNVGAGVVIEVTGGNTTAINLGGGGTVSPASLLRYSGNAAVTSPATLTTTRTIGDLFISNNGALKLLDTSAINAYQGAITLSSGSLIVGANSLLGGLTATPIKLLNGASTFNARATLQFGTGITINRPIDVTALLSTAPGVDANSQRPRILLSTTAGTAGTGTVSGDITYGTVDVGNGPYLEIGTTAADAVLTLSGQIKAPVGQIQGKGVLFNGGNSGSGTIILTNSPNSPNSYTGGSTLTNGSLILTASVPASGASLLGIGSTLAFADGATPEKATLSTLLDGPYSFARTVNLGRNASGGGTEYTSILGMTAAATGNAIWSGPILGGADERNKIVRITAPAAGSIRFSGVISANTGSDKGTGIVTLDKVGAGTAELTAANTYNGNTTVTEGTLVVNNTTGSATSTGTVTVAPGTILSGIGSIAGSVSAAGTVAPGSGGTGTLTIGAATLTGTLAVEVDGSAGDKLTSTGALDLSATTLTVAELAGGFGASPHVIAEGASLIGPFASVPGGYSVSYTTTQALLSKVTSSSPFDSWISTNYPEIPLADRDPGDDPDGDGTSNLLEYALNGDPTSATNQGSIASLIQDANMLAGKELTLVVAVRDGATFTDGAATVDGITYVVEGSLDLNFPSSAVSSTGPSDTAPAATGLPSLAGSAWEYHTFTLNASEGLGGKGFLRLKVSQP